MNLLQVFEKPWLEGLFLLLLSVLLSILGHYLLYSLAKRIALRRGSVTDSSLLSLVATPTRIIFLLLATFIVLPILDLPRNLLEILGRVVSLALIASTAWLILRLTQFFTDLIAARYPSDETNDVSARRIHTQVELLRRIAAVIIGIVALAAMLMTFPTIRHLGATLFASAGIAGLVLGLAVRPTITNLIGGIQIALTQPIRLEDVVVVEGEWGRIEEIEMTYVVVRTWDLRRLIVPLSYFIDHPFQNWTRQTTDLVGTVLIYADYTASVETLRAELHRILQSSNQWDGKAWGLQVTNSTEHVIELRALMSAADSGTLWNLRCEVREKLVRFLQENQPECLPRTRAELRQA